MIQIVLLGVVAVLIIMLFLRKDGRKGKRIPGPLGLPLLGCALDVNTENIHEKFSEYARQYGDIFQVKLMNFNIIGLNTGEMIKEAASSDGYKQYLNDRATTFYGEMMLFGSQSTVFCKNGYSTLHNTYRKGFTRAMQVYGAEGFSAFEERILNEIRSGLMKKIEGYSGKDFEIVSLLQRSLSNTLSCVLRGKPFKDDEPDTNIFMEYSEGANFFANASVNNILTTFPFLRNIPGPYGKEFARTMKKREKIIEIMFKEQKSSHQSGVIRGVVDHFLEEQRKDIQAGREVFYTDEKIISQVLEIIVAGLLTTWSAISNTFLCLVCYPEYQDKMFQELDRVIGHDRDINHNDKSFCPFFEAVELEVHRYITTVPLLLPKLSQNQLEFMGYNIPKGSIIYGNTWFIHHNETIWGDPWNFRPERWLDTDGNLLARDHVFRKNWLPFGYGRRKCIGEQFGRSRYFLYVASLLRRWKFIASPGKPIACDPRDRANFEIKTTMRPKPFLCSVLERY